MIIIILSCPNDTAFVQTRSLHCQYVMSPPPASSSFELRARNILVRSLVSPAGGRPTDCCPLSLLACPSHRDENLLARWPPFFCSYCLSVETSRESVESVVIWRIPDRRRTGSDQPTFWSPQISIGNRQTRDNDAWNLGRSAANTPSDIL